MTSCRDNFNTAACHTAETQGYMVQLINLKKIPWTVGTWCRFVAVGAAANVFSYTLTFSIETAGSALASIAHKMVPRCLFSSSFS